MTDATEHPANRILGRAPALLESLQLVERFGPTELPILLVGETGTGKELFAQLIHLLSGRTPPLVDINCAGLPREIADALLFGHRRGAFTGATDHAGGLIEEAHDSTLFLDELGSLPLEAQAKLLRVLETKELRRIGETKKRTSRFRVVAAVHPNFGGQIDIGSFRLDLLQRVAGAVIRLPALRERGTDVVLLAQAFAAKVGRSLGPGVPEVLCRYRWPGNVRELMCAVQRAVCLTPADVISAAVLAQAIDSGAGSLSAPDEPDVRDPAGSRAAVEEVCTANNWDSRRIAAALGVRKTKLFSILKRHDISLKRITAGSAG